MPALPEPTLPIIFSTSLLVGFSGALLPGPLLAVSISHTARHGFWVGPGIVLGHGILELALLALMYLGLSRILDRPVVTGVVGLVGGGMLLIMGLSMVRSSRHAHMELEGNPERDDSARLRVPLAGAVTSLLNPGWVVWWATIGTTYVLWALGMGLAGLAAFFVGHILADLAWYSFVSGLVASGRRWLRDAAYRGLLAACGLFVLLMGGFFVSWGFGKLG